MPKYLKKNKLVVIRDRIFTKVCDLDVGVSYTTESPLKEVDRIWLMTKLPRKFGEARKFMTRFNEDKTLTITRAT